MVQFQKAERKKGKLRLALAGPSGAGKTYSSLLIAFGLGGKIAMIDTENGSGDLYAGLGKYDICSISSPFTPDKYIEAIKVAEDSGYDVIIVDSLTHAWTGEGGLLDLHGHLTDRSGNSWSAWRKVTPKHNQLVDAMLQSRCHIIATMRSKTEYAQTTENGKATVKKLGMNPIQRDGMEYEFTVFLDLDLDHIAGASKDRTSLFDGKFFKPCIETGKILIQWLESGQEPYPAPEEHRSELLKNEPDPTLSNGLKILFAKVGSYGLNKEAYKDYCYKKYDITSMTKITASQKEEQIKILNSLKNHERLTEFKQLLEGSHKPPNGNRKVIEIPHGVATADQQPSAQAFSPF